MGVGQVAEYRWYGSVWLANTYAKAHYNLAEDLLKAAGCFAAEHALMWQLWDLAGGNGNPDAWQKFADPEVRRKMVPSSLPRGINMLKAQGISSKQWGETG